MSDQYWVSNGFLDLMEIPVIEGRSFTENIPVSDERDGEPCFVEKMKNSWTGRTVQSVNHLYIGT